jgi:hypothetical protein
MTRTGNSLHCSSLLGFISRSSHPRETSRPRYPQAPGPQKPGTAIASDCNLFLRQAAKQREREGYREQTGKSLSACSRLDLRNVERNERQAPTPASSAATKFHIRYKYRDVHMQQVASRNRKYSWWHIHTDFSQSHRWTSATLPSRVETDHNPVGFRMPSQGTIRVSMMFECSRRRREPP